MHTNNAALLRLAHSPKLLLTSAVRNALMIPFAVIMVAAAAPSPNEHDIRPGLWHFAVNMSADTANGERLSTPHHELEEYTSCLSDADADLPKLLAGEALPDECRMYQVHAAKGEISFTAICPVDEDGVSIDMSGAGTYTSDRMSMRIDARAESDGNQAVMSGSVIAIRTGACPIKK